MSSQETGVNHFEQMAADNEIVLAGEFSEPGVLVTVDGVTKSITFIRTGTTDQLMMEPGYADMDTFNTSKAQYPQPKPGDTITAGGVEWLVEPGAKLAGSMWSIPVKSDRRVRS